MKSLRLSDQSAPQTAEADAHDGPSRTEIAMSERLASLDPSSKRHRTLEIALEFKRSWVRLAKHLAEIRAGKLYREWGYRTFEAYGKHELHLKKETVTKLVRSYEFLNQHERQTLDQVEREADEEVVEAPPPELPSYQALDILAEARQNPNLPEADYRELRDQVFRDDPPPSTLRKMVKEKAPEPEKPKEEPGKNLRKALGMAERLYGLLLEEGVPEGVQQSAEELVGGLRRLLEDG